MQQLHDEESITSMGRWLAGLCPGKRPEVLHLQSFVDRESVVFTGLSVPEKAQKERFAQLLRPFVQKACLWGE